MKRNLFLSLILILVIVISAASCNASNDGAVLAPNGGYIEESVKENIDTTDDKDFTKIIKTVTAIGETKEYDDIVTGVKALVAEYGGYVENSNVYGNSYNSSSPRRATFTLRIPTDNLDEFSAEIAELLNLTSVSENMKNVSEEYYDIKAIIETLEAERKGLLNILESIESSTEYDYWLKITERLSAIEKDIAVYKARLQQLDSKVDYSTYNLTVNEVREYTEPKPDTFGDRIADAFSESWEEFYHNAQDVAVFAVSALPTLLVLGAIAGVIIFIVVKADKKKPRK